MAFYDMFGDGDGTMRFQQLHARYGLAYAKAYYHYFYSRNLNDFSITDWNISLIDQGDLVKIGKFMYSLRDIKVTGSASRSSICNNSASVDLGNGSRVLNIYSSIENGNYVPGERYDNGYYLYNHAEQSSWWNIDLEDRVDVSTPCEYLDPAPTQEECASRQGGAYAEVRADAYIESTTKIYNFFDGPPTDSGSDFLGYGYINGPIRAEVSGRYWPNSTNCVEEMERRTDYLVIGNVIRKADSGSGIYTPGTLQQSVSNFNILGVNFLAVRARSTVVGGTYGYYRNDFTGSWEEPDVSSFRYWS